MPDRFAPIEVFGGGLDVEVPPGVGVYHARGGLQQQSQRRIVARP